MTKKDEMAWRDVCNVYWISLMKVCLSTVLAVLLKLLKKGNGDGMAQSTVRRMNTVISWFFCLFVSHHHTLDPGNESVYPAALKRWLAVD